MASLTRLTGAKGIGDCTRKRLKKTIKTINKLNEEYSREYTDTINNVFSELAEHHIRLVNDQRLSDAQKDFLKDFYYDKLNGSTNPIWLAAIDDLNTLEDNRIYLVVKKAHVDDKK